MVYYEVWSTLSAATRVKSLRSTPLSGDRCVGPVVRWKAQFAFWSGSSGIQDHALVQDNSAREIAIVSFFLQVWCCVGDADDIAQRVCNGHPSSLLSTRNPQFQWRMNVCDFICGSKQFELEPHSQDVLEWFGRFRHTSFELNSSLFRNSHTAHATFSWEAEVRRPGPHERKTDLLDGFR